MAITQIDMEKLIRELFKAWSSPEVEPFIALLTDDFVYESPLRVNNGKAEAAAAHKQIFSLVSNLKIDVTSYFFCGDRVCIESIVRGTVKTTGKTFSAPCASICEMNGNKIRRMTEYYNLLPFQQAAVLPPKPQE